MLLNPLRKTLKRLGIYLLTLPTAKTRPGALLDRRRKPLQYLTDVSGFFDLVGGVEVAEPSPSSAVVTSHRMSLGVGGEVGAGLPQMASLRVGASYSKEVLVEIGPLHEVRLQRKGQVDQLESLDYLYLFNQQLDYPGLRIAYGLMKRRKRWFPFRRELDVAEALIYADWIRFTFLSSGGGQLEAELPTAAVADVEVGLDVSVDCATQVTWNNGLRIPLGYRPVRYAWDPKSESFSIAVV